MFGPNLAAYQLTTLAENVVKFKLKLSKKWKRKPKSGKQNVGSFIPIFHDFVVFLQIFSKF